MWGKYLGILSEMRLGPHDSLPKLPFTHSTTSFHDYMDNSSVTAHWCITWTFLNLDSSICFNTPSNYKFCWFFQWSRLFFLWGWMTYVKNSEHYTCSFYVVSDPYKMWVSSAADQITWNFSLGDLYQCETSIPVFSQISTANVTSFSLTRSLSSV